MIRQASEHDLEQVLAFWTAAGSAETVTDTREGERRLLARGGARVTAIVADDEFDALSFWTATGYERQHSRARFVRNIERPARTSAETR